MRLVVLISFYLLVSFGCKQEKKYHDATKKETLLAQTDELQEIIQFQIKMNEEFKNPETSPLPDRYRKNFESLDYFDPNPEYIVKAKFVRTPHALPFLMPTTTDRKSHLFGRSRKGDQNLNVFSSRGDSRRFVKPSRMSRQF